MTIPAKQLKNGTMIPIVGLGTWELIGETCTNLVKLALDVGYRHIDTAQQYDNQECIKKGIEGFPREDLFIASKLQWDFLEPQLVEENCDRALKELGCEYLDLFNIHWPNKEKPLSKVVEKLLELKEKGKIKNVGTCNFTVHHLQDLLDDGLHVCQNQVEFHPYLCQNNLLEFCTKNEIAVTGYCPLAHGEVFTDPKLKRLSEKYNKPLSQICLRWLVQRGVIVIPKGDNKEQLQQNLQLFDFELSEEDVINIQSYNRGHRIVAPPIHEFDY